MCRELRAAGVDAAFLRHDLLQPALCLWRGALCHDAAAAGIDGLIVPDLPPEEAEELEVSLPRRRAGDDLLCSRRPVRRNAFVWWRNGPPASSTSSASPASPGRAPSCRLTWPSSCAGCAALPILPLAVGFGIGSGAQAAAVAAFADGVIVGSALVKGGRG
jgi:tryptophan synthase alpha chain